MKLKEVMMINKKLAQMMIKEPIQAQVTVDEGKLYLYGDIGDDWNGVTLDSVRRVTSTMDKSQLTIYINSYGGDATEGVAIRNYLRSSFEKIDVVIDGIAASAASVIATCGDTLKMPSGTTFMIHNPWTLFIGNRTDLIREEKTLASLEQSYRDIYMERFTGTEKELIQLMDDETWLTAEQSVSFGFANGKTKDIEDKSNEVETSPLVASLLNKHVAKADDNDTKTKEIDENDEEVINDDLEKENNFLSNLTKAFSQI